MSRASAILRAAVLFGVAALAVVLAPGTSADTAPSYYLSLGDSLARGWQPDGHGHSGETTQGYVDDVADGLRARDKDLRVVKLGCPGERTVTMMNGGICHYQHGNQLAEAEAFLQSHPGQVAAVTVNIGDNDVEQCMSGGTLDSACVRNQMGIVRSRLAQIAARVHAAAGPDAQVVGLTDYDQFLGYWIRGAPGFARRSVGVVTGLNRMADGIYRRAGVAVADATRAFATTNLSRFVHTSHSYVPVAVARICAWTWACSGPPVNFNDHANAQGYRALARVILAELH